MSQAFNKIAHLAIALQNTHTFTRDQGIDIFYFPSYSVNLSHIDTYCSIVKPHVGRMANIKDRHFEKSLSNLGELEVLHSDTPK